MLSRSVPHWEFSYRHEVVTVVFIGLSLSIPARMVLIFIIRKGHQMWIWVMRAHTQSICFSLLPSLTLIIFLTYMFTHSVTPRLFSSAHAARRQLHCAPGSCWVWLQVSVFVKLAVLQPAETALVGSADTHTRTRTRTHTNTGLGVSFHISIPSSVYHPIHPSICPALDLWAAGPVM